MSKFYCFSNIRTSLPFRQSHFLNLTTPLLSLSFPPHLVFLAIDYRLSVPLLVSKPSSNLISPFLASSGYLESCRSIVGAAKTVAQKIKEEIPELYILGNPPASVVAFSSKHPDVKIYEVGDAMSQKGWHLNALNDPAALHIACTVSLAL